VQDSRFFVVLNGFSAVKTAKGRSDLNGQLTAYPQIRRTLQPRVRFARFVGKQWIQDYTYA
jgi:hypothetical protein